MRLREGGFVTLNMRLWEGFGQKMKSQFGHQREGGREYCVCFVRCCF